MITALTAAILFIGLVGVALLGRRVRRYLPEDHLSADSKDAVKLAMGLIATMTAVLLGLLISSAKGTYDTVQSEVMQMAGKVGFLDRVLALYGPEAATARHACRDAVAEAVRRMWPGERGGPARLAPNEQMGDEFYAAVHRLSPHDDSQRALKAQVVTLMVELGQLRSLLQAQAIPSISRPLLIALGAHGVTRPTEDSFHGNTSVAKNVTASASASTIRYANPPKRNLKILKNQPCR